MQKKLKNLFSSFWTWQFLGWISYWILNSLSLITNETNESNFYNLTEFIIFYNLAGLILIKFSFGFILSSLMRFIYISKFSNASITKNIFLILGYSLFFGNVWAYLMLTFSAFMNSQTLYVGFTIRFATEILEFSLTLLAWSVFYIGIKYWQTLQTERKKTLEVTNLAQETELKMLRYQLNPHFLFNSLNSASALIRENPNRAERMIDELSDFLRYSLTDTKADKTTLANEIEAIKNYLNIEQIRFEEKISVQFDISPKAEDFKLPNFLLHPLIENAIKYGMQTSELPLQIEIKAAEKSEKVIIEIINTGKWQENINENQNGTKIGLENVRKRLEQFFPNRHRFKISKGNNCVSVLIEINQ